VEKKNIKENISKSELSKELSLFLGKDEFKSKVEKIVKDRLKNDKELEDKVVEITKNVLTQLYKALWTKKSFWRDNLSNKAN
jgi:tryptophanyl-tRNA synthetase